MLIHPGMAKCSDLPALLRAAGAESWALTLLTYRDRTHTANWCAPAVAVEELYTLDGRHGKKLEDTTLCTECALTARPGLRSLAREGGCQLALERLREIGAGAPLHETAEIWELLDENYAGAGPDTLRDAEAALEALANEWASWERGRLGADEQVHITASEVPYGPGIAIWSAARRYEGEEYTLLTGPREYEHLIRKHTQSTLGWPLGEEDSPEVLETALTLWHDGDEGGTNGVGAVLERARLVHHRAAQDS